MDDPQRIGVVEESRHPLGVLPGRRPLSHATVYATGLLNLQAKVVIDMVEGNAATDLRRWSAKADVDGWAA